EVGLDAMLAQSGQHRERGRDERGLLHRRVEQLLRLGVEAQSLEVEAARHAASLEHGPRSGYGLREVATHAGLERALAGKAKRHLAQTAPPIVHRINALPHVRPAPIPVMSTRLPARSLPSAWASASASGIEPDDVLP